jgi:hypothetical protein
MEVLLSAAYQRVPARLAAPLHFQRGMQAPARAPFITNWSRRRRAPSHSE